MLYKCPRCHYETNYITSYRNHLSRKKICNADFSEENPIDILNILNEQKKIHNYKCEHCDKIFTSSQGKYQHKQRCFNQNEVTKLKSELVEMKNEIIEIKNHPVTTIINNNITNNIQQNNIVLENFCKEDVEFLSDTFIRKCLSRVANGFEDLTKKIHFNPSKPEYHNVTITNKKDSYLEVFKDNKWQFQDKNVTLDALIKQCFDILSGHYDRYEDEIKEQFSKTQLKQVDQLVDNLYNKDKSTQSKLRQYLYLVILNNRNIAKEK